MMFNGLFGLGRAYRRLPPHNNYVELAANMERLADYLIDKSVGSGGEKYKKAPDRWEWKLGHDLKMLVAYARDHVPDDSDGLHYFSTQRKRRSLPQ
jgi:hypothetical protein